MKKRILALLLAMALVLQLAACGGERGSLLPAGHGKLRRRTRARVYGTARPRARFRAYHRHGPGRAGSHPGKAGRADGALSSLRAVAEDRLYTVPSEIEAWDYPQPSSILGLLWMAHVLHPELVSEEEYGGS